MAIIAQGAEATIERMKEGVVKRRVPKGYRHPELDRTLRAERTRAEANLLAKAAAVGVRVPRVLGQDGDALVLERINGPLVRDRIDARPSLARGVGMLVAKLHDASIIHGDLTTSNMVLAAKGVVLLDFGLGFVSRRAEDKAVDMHVFLQSVASRHHRIERRARTAFLDGYRASRDAVVVLERLRSVEARGRNKRA
jgi:N6-L-threonylcarbamoyladenine synthase/protein kinase Bud32